MKLIFRGVLISENRIPLRIKFRVALRVTHESVFNEMLNLL